MLALPAAMANERVQVVTSFSILADMVENVGGEHVTVSSLVGPDGDAHVFSPSPGDARALAGADLVVFNGLLFEGWMERLIVSSDYSGPMVTATDGLSPRAFAAHSDDEHGGAVLGAVGMTVVRGGRICLVPSRIMAIPRFDMRVGSGAGGHGCGLAPPARVPWGPHHLCGDGASIAAPAL